MIVVTGQLRVDAGNLERVRPHMSAVIEVTRRETGCRLYAFAEDVLDPGLIRIVERWDDWASLDAHQQSPHVAAWRAALKEIGARDREVTAHEADRSRAL